MHLRLAPEAEVRPGTGGSVTETRPQSPRGDSAPMRCAVRCRWVAFFTLTVFIAGCTSSTPTSENAVEDVKVDLAIKPDPPKVGDAEAVVTLKDKDGKPIRGATVKLEGNMNHAGMQPVFADAREIDAGQYQATLKFTMGGDWFILITGSLPDGRKLNRKIDVPGVKSR